jgi:hypothetical protein
MHFDDVKNRNHWKIRASLMMARQKQGVDRSGRKNAGFDSWCYALDFERHTQFGFQIQFEALKN